MCAYDTAYDALVHVHEHGPSPLDVVRWLVAPVDDVYGLDELLFGIERGPESAH